MKSIFRFDIGTQESLKKIFGALLINPQMIEDKELAEYKYDVQKQALGLFLTDFPVNIFFNEYYFIYQVFKESKVRLFSPEQLKSLIYYNQSDILESPYIELKVFGRVDNSVILSDTEKIEAFTEDIIEKVTELTNLKVSFIDFESACNHYLDVYKTQLMQNTANTMSIIMQPDGYIEEQKRGKKRFWQGIDDCVEYFTIQRSKINVLEDDSKVGGYTVIDNDYALQENSLDTNNDNDTESILDYGIKEIDDVAGKMRRGNLINIMGITKGGKTTFATYLTERALRQGLNVCIWSLEGTIKERQTIIESLCAFNLENDSCRVDRNTIYSRNYHNNRERQAIANARTVLASPQYGNLTYINSTAYVEDWEDVLLEHYRRVNAFDVLIFDSPVLILSRYGMGKVERISETIIKLKSFLVNKVNAVGIMTSQLKQEHIDKMRSKNNETIDVTAGGDSAETTRTPDEVIGLFSTKIERSNGQIKLYNIASRHHDTFQDFYVGCDLGIGNFYSKPELNE